MKTTRQDFLAEANRIAAIRLHRHRSAAIAAAILRFQRVPSFDADRFIRACNAVAQTNPDRRFNIHHNVTTFTLTVEWPKCDVDACVVPALSIYCGRVTHEVGADRFENQPDYQPEAEGTPIDGTVECLIDVFLMGEEVTRYGVAGKPSTAYIDRQRIKFPKSAKPTAAESLMQGTASFDFEYEGNLQNMGSVIQQCQTILEGLVRKHVGYHHRGDTVENSNVNVFAGSA